MSSNVATAGPYPTQTNRRKTLHIALWVAQGLLAIAFGMIGGMKTFTPIAELAKGPMTLPPELIRFIGVSELAGAIGLILPAATRIRPVLTPIAASGLALVMVLAAAFHASRGEFSSLPITFVFGGIAAFIAWGRFKAAPIQPRD